MTHRTLTCSATVLTACLELASNAKAQPVDTFGIRAQGMAGAFVAAADDPSAVYWNAAGLAEGPFFGVLLEGSTTERTPSALDPDAARRTGVMFAASAPALGFAYYRLEERAVVAAGDHVGLRSLVTQYVATSLVQSLADGLAVGTTLKYLHGEAAEAFVAVPPGSFDVEAWLDQADLLDRQGSDTFDMDVGVLGVFGPVRAGLVARHLTEPTLRTQAGFEVRLERQVRAGVAVRASDRLSVEADVDVVESLELSGRPRRDVALGVEGTLWRGLLVRGGVRASLIGETSPVPAVGASAALGRRLWIDGQWTLGERGRHAGWGIAVRIGT